MRSYEVDMRYAVFTQLNFQVFDIGSKAYRAIFPSKEKQLKN